MKHLKWVVLFLMMIAAFAAFVAPAIRAGDPGSSPFDAIRVNGEWKTLAPKSTIWYYFDYTGDKTRIQVFLQNNLSVDYPGLAEKVGLAIYSPNQIPGWLNDPGIAPAGRGSKPAVGSNVGTYDLVWQGGFNLPGRYSVAIQNDNAKAIDFRLTVVGESVTLLPTRTPTVVPTPLFSTPVAQGSVQGRFLMQEWSGGAIYTFNGDGSDLKKITTGLDPAWSPDGKQIAFIRWTTPGGLYIADADGSNEFLLYDPPLMQSPRWSPDGKKIAFTQQKGGGGDSVIRFGSNTFRVPGNPSWKLGVVEIAKVISADETRPTLTEPACTAHCFSPSWNPKDPRYIGFSDSGVGILRSDTLSNTFAAVLKQPARIQSATWSPDGNRFAYQIWQNDHWEIAISVWDGTNPTALTQPNPFAFKQFNNAAPSWSPDGNELIFLSDRHGKWELFAINIDGTGLRQVLKNVTDKLDIHYYFSNERVIDWRR